MKRKLFMTVCSLAAAAALTVCGTAAVQAEGSQNGSTAAIIIDDGPAAAVSDQNDIRGGTNQNDAFLLPKETKLYGSVMKDEVVWFAFTTDDTENAVYALTLINKSLDTSWIRGYVYDEYGTQVVDGYYWRAGSDGKAVTSTNDELKPNTTYYLRITNEDSDRIDYMLRIRNMTTRSEAYKTAENVNEAIGTGAAKEGIIVPGTNQDDAGYIPLDAKIGGTIQNDDLIWFAFTTDDTVNGAYSFTLVNETPGSDWLRGYVYDEYGTQVIDGYYWRAGADGKAATTENDDLEPNTTYYMCLSPDSEGTLNYTLRITTPEKPEGSTATVTADEEPLVFEEPFELNETQVMFVVNQAAFIDEAAAKEALKPAADAILAHPEASILIAGTTATDGTQESCVSLSNERAEAVKNLLVSAFGVPESQLQTIGLGYADDPFVRGKDRIPEGDVNGRFVESEGAKNRRVVVMDAESDIAKQILGQ